MNDKSKSFNCLRCHKPVPIDQKVEVYGCDYCSEECGDKAKEFWPKLLDHFHELIYGNKVEK